MEDSRKVTSEEMALIAFLANKPKSVIRKFLFHFILK